MKKVLTLFLALMLCLSLAAPALAADETSGTCGENVTWSYSDGTLTISGTGSVYDEFDAETGEMFRGMPWGRYYEEIRAVNIADGVTGIGTGAFHGFSSLTSVTIPASVTYIGAGAFGSCTSLASINVASGNTAYSSVDGVLFSADQTLLHSYPAGKSGLSYSIPESVTTIGNYAFARCSGLTGVTIPDSVTTIKRVAFMNCESLTSMTIPDSVTTIGDSAFSGCSGLTSVTIPSGLTTLEDGVFNRCSSLTSVTIPDSVTSIGSSFRWCEGLTSVTIPGSVTSIGVFAFDGCSALTSVAIPASVASIEWGAFNECYKLTDIYYGGSESQWKQIEIDDAYNKELTGATIHYSGAAPSTSESIPATGTAHPSAQTVALDGKQVEFQMYALLDEAGDPTNYIRVRDLAMALNGTKGQFNVDWIDNAVTLVAGAPYTTPNGSENTTPFSDARSYKLPENSTNVNGAAGGLTAFVLTDDDGGDHTYYQLRDLGRALGFNVGWSAERGVFIESDKPYTDAD